MPTSKSIYKVINEKGENLVYIKDATKKNKDLLFPNKEYSFFDKENAVLDFFFKSSINKNIKLVTGSLIYLKRNSQTEFTGSLDVGFNTPILKNDFFSISMVDDKFAKEYNEKEEKEDAKNLTLTIEEFRKSRKEMVDLFGIQGIVFKEKHLIFFVTGNQEKILSIKFFDENNQQITLLENLDGGVYHRHELFTFYFPKKPNKNWKIKIYTEDPSSMVEIPFEINLN